MLDIIEIDRRLYRLEALVAMLIELIGTGDLTPDHGALFKKLGAELTESFPKVNDAG